MGYFSIIKNVSFADKLPKGKEAESFFVRSYKIDDLVVTQKVIKDVKFIKIDAEGAEIDILNGSMNVLKSYHPTIFLSVHPKILSQKKQTTDELFNLLKDLNYKIFDKNNLETNKFSLDEYICK